MTATLPAPTLKAARTTTVSDMCVESSNHRAPTQPWKALASFDRTRAPHKGHSWHGDARPISPARCRPSFVASGVVGRSGGEREETKYNVSKMLCVTFFFQNTLIVNGLGCIYKTFVNRKHIFIAKNIHLFGRKAPLPRRREVGTHHHPKGEGEESSTTQKERRTISPHCLTPDMMTLLELNFLLLN